MASESTSGSAALSAIDRKRAYAERVAGSRTFARAEQLRRLLVWLARRTLDNLPHPTEYEVACAALRRPADFDPQTDSLVRREMNRLRAKLREYYAGEGSGDSLRIGFAGPYRLTFELQDSPVSVETAPAARCLLVLPLYAAAAGADAAENFYAELLAHLAAFDGLELVAQTTARAYSRSPADARSLAKETGAEFVLEGTARALDHGLTVTLWLVDRDTGRTRVLCRLTGNVDELARLAADAVRTGPLRRD